MTVKYDKEKFLMVAKEAVSMQEASREMGISYTTFKRIAKKLNVYKPNQGGVGVKKSYESRTFKIEDIFNGLHPKYKSYKLKKRLIEEGYKEHRCEICDVNAWNGCELTLELHHIDGNSMNNELKNLQILCPNCHSQTESYRGRNKASSFKKEFL